MMKTIVDTPEFTAWLMGELPVDEAASMARTVAADPALELAAREQQQFLQSLTGLLGGSQETLNSRQREKIMSAARVQASDVIVPLPQRNAGRGWGWISLATAAVAVVGVWLGYQNPLKPGNGGLAFEEVTREIALLPTDAVGFPNDSAQETSTTAVGGNTATAQRDALLTRQPDEFMRVMANRIATEPLPTAAELPGVRERGFVDAQKHPLAPLPVHVGTASWNWVKRSITEQQALPHASLVRSEEIINAFHFAAGQELSANGLVVRAEGFTNRADRARVIVSVRNDARSAQSFSWSYQPSAEARYRIVGFGAPSTSAAGGTMLPAGGTVTLMLEVESSSLQDGLGAILLTSGVQERRLPLTMAASTSTEAVFFSLLTDFATWLRKPTAAPSELQNSIQSLEQQTLSAEQMTALSIMKKALVFEVN